MNMEKYDYYAIKAAWNGANVSQRADDLKAAEKISDDLKGNGFIDVVIFGVKAGKREKLEGGKQAKPKAQERPRKSKKPKAQANAAPKVKTTVKAAKKPQDNGGQLDLFSSVKKARVKFNYSEILEIRNALDIYGFTKNAYLTSEQHKNIIDVFNSVSDDFNIELSFNELQFIILALDYSKKFESDWARLEKTKKLINQLLNISDTLQ